MQKSTFRVRVFEAPQTILALFAQSSSNLTTRQRARLLTGGAA